MMKRILLLLSLLSSLLPASCALETATTTTDATTSTSAGGESATTTLGYDAYGVLADYDGIFDRPEGTYLVYIYSSTCSHCLSIRDEMLAFAASYGTHPFYSLCIDEADGEGIDIFLDAVGRTAVAVPCLLVVVDGGVPADRLADRFFLGTTEIRNALVAMLDGTYAGWE
jgi:thiol-disulfide isomerase/thioredoxin